MLTQFENFRKNVDFILQANSSCDTDLKNKNNTFFKILELIKYVLKLFYEKEKNSFFSGCEHLYPCHCEAFTHNIRSSYGLAKVIQILYVIQCMIIISVYVNNEYLINVGVGLGVHTQIHPIG